MNLIKIFLGTAIMLLGIAGSFLIYQKNNALLPAQSETQKSNKVAANQPFQPLKESLTANTGENAPQNLTDLFTEQIGRKILEENPTGPELVDGEPSLRVPDPDQIANEIVLEAKNKFNEDLRPIIKDSDLKISSDATKEALQKYFSSFKNIIQTAEFQIQKGGFLDSGNISPESLKTYANIYEGLLGKFYSLTVPAPALPIHKKELELLEVKYKLLKAMANYPADPIVAILASQELENLQGEFILLTNQIAGFFQKNQIEI